MAIFDDAGSIDILRNKSLALTGYLEFLISEINKQQGIEIFKIITPVDRAIRGCQLSVVCGENAKAIFGYLAEKGVIGDWREPDVIRLSAVPLYNTFQDVYHAAKHMADALVAVK
jgi:kynureninase